MEIKEERGKIIVELKSRKEKVRCPICNKFTNSVHDKLRPIKSVYLDSGGKEVNLIITKRRFNCYKCNKRFTEQLDLNTKEGKYAFILTDPIHKKVLDILPNRKKEYLVNYFTHTNNRYSVKFVISDMYEPYLLVQQLMFPHAKYIVDKFHYTMYSIN